MTTMTDRVDPLEFDLQPAGSTAVYFYSSVLSHLDDVSRCVFAIPTPYTVFAFADRRSAYVPLRSSIAAPPSRVVPILDAVDDLRSWLHVSYDDLAKILGWQSASTIYHWRRSAKAGDPVRPQAATVEPILRLHALLRAVNDTISGEQDPNAVKQWLRTPLGPDVTTPLDLLRERGVDDLESQATQLLFGEASATPPAWRAARLPDEDDLPTSPSPLDYSAEDFG